MSTYSDEITTADDVYMAKLKEIMYVVVQHSGYGYAGDSTFKKGLEVRSLETEAQVGKIVAMGGKVFPTWADADNYCEREMWRNTHGTSLIPSADGTFSYEKVDGLAIYIPKEK